MSSSEKPKKGGKLCETIMEEEGNSNIVGYRDEDEEMDFEGDEESYSYIGGD